MANRIYTFVRVFTATADAAVNIIAVKACRIKIVQWSIQADLDADGEMYAVELGSAPTMQSTTHDSQGAISVVSAQNYLLTSGASVSHCNFAHSLDYPWQQGQKLYLHGGLTGTNSVLARCIVHVTE